MLAAAGRRRTGARLRHEAASQCQEAAINWDRANPAAAMNGRQRPAPRAGLIQGSVVLTRRVPGCSTRAQQGRRFLCAGSGQRTGDRNHGLGGRGQRVHHGHRVHAVRGPPGSCQAAVSDDGQFPPACEVWPGGDQLLDPGERAQPLTPIDGFDQNGEPVPQHRGLVEPARRTQPVQFRPQLTQYLVGRPGDQVVDAPDVERIFRAVLSTRAWCATTTEFGQRARRSFGRAGSR